MVVEPSLSAFKEVSQLPVATKANHLLLGLAVALDYTKMRANLPNLELKEQKVKINYVKVE